MREKPRLWWQDMPERYEQTPTAAVTVDALEPRQTGLLDADGNPIMRSPEKMGFLK